MMVTTTYIKNKRMSIGTNVSLIIACFYCVSILIFNISMPILPHLLFALWVFATFLAEGKKLIHIFTRQRFALFYVFCIYFLFASMFAFSTATSINRVITMFELIIPFVMYEIYSEYGNKARKYFIIVITIVLLLNIREMQQVIISSFGLGLKQHEGNEFYLDTAFHQVYSLALIAGYIVYLLRVVGCKEIKNKVIIKACLIVALLIICFIVTISMYATALFLMIIGMILGFIYGRPNWRKKTLVIGISVIIGFVILFPLILYLVQTYIPDSKILVIRFQEVMNILDGQADEDASSSARAARSLISLNTFMENPLFGMTYKLQLVEDMKDVGLGNHAEWIDGLALYGIFAFALYSFIYKTIKVTYRNSDIGVLVIMFFLLGFFNKCLYVIFTVLIFLYAPFIHDYILSLETKKKQHNIIE